MTHSSRLSARDCRLVATTIVAVHLPFVVCPSRCDPRLSLVLFCFFALWALFYSSFFIPILFHRRKRLSKGWSRPSISSFHFISPPPPNSPAHSSLFCPTHLNYALSNTSPLAFPTVRLDPSRSGLIGTRTPQHHGRDDLPSPGEQKFGHSASGHSDGADD
jgi:hypothetical protein